MNLTKKIKYLQSTLLEIISQLNLTFNKKPNFENLAAILHYNNLINEKYYIKIVTLDSIDENDLKSSKSLKMILNVLMILDVFQSLFILMMFIRQ